MDLVLPLPPRRGGAVALLAITVIGVGAASTAGTAEAATIVGAAVNCLTPGALTIAAEQGESFTLTLTGCDGQALSYDTSLLSATVANGTVPTPTTSITFTVKTGAAPGTHTSAVTIGTLSTTGTLTVTPTPPAPTPPPSWYQSYARASWSQACDATWHPSWAQWPHGGLGGPTCDRVYEYNGSTGMWAYRSGTVVSLRA